MSSLDQEHKHEDEPAIFLKTSSAPANLGSIVPHRLPWSLRQCSSVLQPLEAHSAADALTLPFSDLTLARFVTWATRNRWYPKDALQKSPVKKVVEEPDYLFLQSIPLFDRHHHQDLFELLELAHFLDVPALMDLCAAYVRDRLTHVTPEQAAELAGLAPVTNPEEQLEFIRRHWC